MSFSDETLMAFADGELDEQTRREVELALRDDPALAEKVRQHKAMRSNVFNAFSSTLAEEVPQRLQAAARSGKVVHLDSVRQVRTPPPVVPPEKPGWAWPQWGALGGSSCSRGLASRLIPAFPTFAAPMACGPETHRQRSRQTYATTSPTLMCGGPPGGIGSTLRSGPPSPTPVMRPLPISNGKVGCMP